MGALLIRQRRVITDDIHSMPLLAAMFWPGRHRNPDRRAGCRPTARPPTATPLAPSVKVATAARRVVTLSAQSARPPRPQSTPIRHIGSGASHGTVPDIQCLILSAWSLRYKWRGGCANVTARRKSRTSTNHLLAETGHLAFRLRLAPSHKATLRPNDSIAASTDQHAWSNLSDSANRLCSNIVRDG